MPKVSTQVKRIISLSSLPLQPLSIDFGISHFKNTTATMATQNLQSKVKGTLQFLAPELILGISSVSSPASDMWALGCLLAQLFSSTVQTPWDLDVFSNDGMQELKIRMENEDMPDVLEDVDLSVKNLVKKCLEYDPTERITAASLREKLEAFHSKAVESEVFVHPPVSKIEDDESDSSTDESIESESSVLSTQFQRW